jgi:putative restriction endonuclease
VWRFCLEKLPAVTDPAPTDLGARRVPTTIQRIVRNTQQGQYLKTLYDYRCQVCEIRLAGSSGPYAESAHIRPLGAPHHGEDALSNILCLCPNHHVLLDFGGFTILDDFNLLGIGSALYVHKKHDLDPANLHYHRSHFYKFI